MARRPCASPWTPSSSTTALRATGLLKQGRIDDGPKVTCVTGPLREGNSRAVVFDLPRGSSLRGRHALQDAFILFTVDESREAFLAVDDQEPKEPT